MFPTIYTLQTGPLMLGETKNSGRSQGQFKLGAEIVMIQQPEVEVHSVQPMIDAMIRWATGLRAAIALAALLLGGSALFQLGPYETVKSMSAAPTLPEETLTGPAALAEFLDGLDDATRAAYARFQVWDLPNLALFGTAGVLVLGWLLNLTSLEHTRWRGLAAFPFVLGFADLAENGVLALAIGSFPQPAPTSVLLPWVTGTKFAAVLLMMFASVLLLGTAAIQRVRTGRKND